MQIKIKHELLTSRPKNFFNVLLRNDSTSSRSVFHCHNAYEIYLSRTESLQVIVGNKTYPPGKGHLYIFNNLDIHKPDLQPGKIYDRYMIHFMPEFVENLCTTEIDLMECFSKRDENFSHCMILSNEQYSDLQKLFEKAYDYQENKTIYARDVKSKVVLADILLYINLLYKTCQPSPPVSLNKEYDRIKTVITNINKNINKSISIDDIANDLFITKRHLETCFKSAMGCTIKEYVMNQKIENAKQFLKQDFLVTEVSKMTGFKSVTHFIRSFKARTGVSPKQYYKNSI